MVILLTAFHTLHIFKLSLTDFQNFPGLSSPGKYHSKIPGHSRFSRTRINWNSQVFRETREKGFDGNRLDTTPTRYTPRLWCHKRGSFGSSSI